MYTVLLDIDSKKFKYEGGSLNEKICRVPLQGQRGRRDLRRWSDISKALDKPGELKLEDRRGSEDHRTSSQASMAYGFHL